VDPSIVTISSQNVEYIVLVVDLAQVEVDLANSKKKKRTK
jgi:hypothetical protein